MVDRRNHADLVLRRQIAGQATGRSESCVVHGRLLLGVDGTESAMTGGVKWPSSKKVRSDFRNCPVSRLFSRYATAPRSNTPRMTSGSLAPLTTAMAALGATSRK